VAGALPLSAGAYRPNAEDGAEEGRAANRQGVMRLQPYQIVFIMALFWTGLLFALMFLHGQTQPPEYGPFQAPL
jgi:hypothetical protein